LLCGVLSILLVIGVDVVVDISFLLSFLEEILLWLSSAVPFGSSNDDDGVSLRVLVVCRSNLCDIDTFPLPPALRLAATQIYFVLISSRNVFLLLACSPLILILSFTLSFVQHIGCR